MYAVVRRHEFCPTKRLCRVYSKHNQSIIARIFALLNQSFFRRPPIPAREDYLHADLDFFEAAELTALFSFLKRAKGLLAVTVPFNWAVVAVTFEAGLVTTTGEPGLVVKVRSFPLIVPPMLVPTIR